MKEALVLGLNFNSSEKSGGSVRTKVSATVSGTVKASYMLGAEASASSIDRYPAFKPSQSSTTFLRLRGLLTEKKCFKKNLSASESSSNKVEYLSCRTKILRASNMKSPGGIDFLHLRARSEMSAMNG